MSLSYDAAQWSNFFIAEVGASAALVGLLFVAVSINLDRIIELPSLPGRAFEALSVLVMVLLVASFALVPGQSKAVLGTEILLAALGCWATTVFIQHEAPRHVSEPRIWMISRVTATQIATLPMIVGGGSLLAGHGGGLHWTVVGVVASFLAALIDAWVLLVEIKR